MSEEPHIFTRNPEDVSLRQSRADIYRRLRPQNIEIRERRSGKKRKGGEDLDDLLGGSDDFSTNRTSGARMQVSNLIKQVKAAYQRLATLKSENKDQIIEQIRSVNLARFLPEVVENLMSAKLTALDIVAFVEVSSILYQLYPDFLDLLEPRIMSEMVSPDSSQARKRVMLCSYVDLMIVQVIVEPRRAPGARPLSKFQQVVNQLMESDIASGKFENHPLIWKLVVHAGGDMFGTTRGGTSVIDPIFPTKELVCPELRRPLKNYYDEILKAMKEKSTQGANLIAEANNLFATKGYTNTRQEKEAKEARQQYDELFKMARQYGFVMKLSPDPTWTEKDQICVSTPNGTMMIDRDAADRIPDFGVLPKSETTEFYSKVADMTLPVTQLGLDITGIKNELDRMTTPDRCDEVARWYVRIDTPEKREELKTTVSQLQRARLNQAPFFARFVASVSQQFPDIAEAVSGNLEKAFHAYVTKCQNNDGVSSQPKLHVARYIAELAKFRIGIDKYMSCLTHSLRNFRGRTIDMTCTLLFIAGEFLDALSDQTHIQIRSKLEDLKKLRESVAYKAHDILMLNQAINLFEPAPPDTSPAPEPVYNRYQAYVQSLFLKADVHRTFSAKARKVIEKMRMQESVTKVDFPFLLRLVLDLQSYSIHQYQAIAKFVADFSKTNPEFFLLVCDVLLERVRRGIERHSREFRQQQLCEVRFIAELCEADVLPIRVGLETCALILSHDLQRPSTFMIRVDSPRAPRIQLTPSDWFRVELVCCLLDGLINALATAILKRDDEIRRWTEYILVWVQLFCFVRTPIPAAIAFRVDEVLAKVTEKQFLPQPMRFDSLDELKQVPSPLADIKSSFQNTWGNPYHVPIQGHSILRPRVQPRDVKRPQEEEDYDSDIDGDDGGERQFLRELAEFREDMEQESRAQGPPVKKSVPSMLELLKIDQGQRTAQRMTANGPPPEFQVVIPKGTGKQETITFSLPPPQ